MSKVSRSTSPPLPPFPLVGEADGREVRRRNGGEVKTQTQPPLSLMVVTKIERQKKNTRRASIYLDGKFAFGVHVDTITQFGLRKGDVLDQKKLEELQKAEELLRAKDKAMRLLSHRARSEKEIRDRLRQASYSSSIIQEVVSALKRSGLLDDVAFARLYAHDTIARKPLGKRLLRRQLRTKGIADETIDRLITELYTPDAEESLALALAKKRLGLSLRLPSTKKQQEWFRQKKRLVDYLVRRGFDWDTATSIATKVLPKQS